MTTLSIVIISYNTKDLTIRCIESLVGQYRKELERGEFEIIVVDNASTDGTREMIKEEFLSRHSGKRPKGAHPESLMAIGDSGQARMTQNENILIIRNKENLGFAKGCNIGARESEGKYILFLNSDTEVLDRGFLNMVDFLDANNVKLRGNNVALRKEIGILGGKLLNLDQSPQPSAGKFYTMLNFLLLLIGGERFGWLRSTPPKITRVDWVSGACLVVSRKLFDRLKGFDEHFFMYMEDMELCFRAKDLGFTTYFYPNTKVIHRSLGSSNREFAVKNINKGILYFYKKHKSYRQYLLVKTLLMLKGAVRT